jgi:DNA polymerase III subunit alpha
MGKKKPEEMAKQRVIFVKGCLENGVEEHRAVHIFDLMEKFAGYGFNKSHSAAYAVLTFQTAWLKAHYPAAFMAAVLSCDMAHTDKVVIFIEECKRMKLPLIPPDINLSDYRFTVNSENQIIYGLGAIKGIGEAAINNILEARSHRPFNDIFDFCARVDGRKISKRVLEALIKCGALDKLAEHRAAIMEYLPFALQAAEQLGKNRDQNQVDLFGDSLSLEDLGSVPVRLNIPQWTKQELLEGEKETLGFYLSGHPLEQVAEELSHITTSTIRDLRIDRNKKCIIAGLVASIRSLQTKKGDRMAFLGIDDQTGRQEVAIFSDLYQSKREYLVKDALVIIEGELGIDDYSGGYKMRATNILNLDEARGKSAKFLQIDVSAENLDTSFTESLNVLLRQHKGEGSRIKICYRKTNVKSMVQLDETWKVKPCQILLEQLQAIKGVTQVELCY